jgi:hypothetical protein
MYVENHTFRSVEETEISAFFTAFSSAALRTETRGSHVFAVTDLAKQSCSTHRKINIQPFLARILKVKRPLPNIPN